MPYAIKKRGNKYAVVKKDGSKTFGSHSSKGKAQAQMRALYANESFEIKLDKVLKEDEEHEPTELLVLWLQNIIKEHNLPFLVKVSGGVVIVWHKDTPLVGTAQVPEDGALIAGMPFFGDEVRPDSNKWGLNFKYVDRPPGGPYVELRDPERLEEMEEFIVQYLSDKTQ